MLNLCTLKIFSSWLSASSWSLRTLEHANIDKYTFALLWCLQKSPAYCPSSHVPVGHWSPFLPAPWSELWPTTASCILVMNSICHWQTAVLQKSCFPLGMPRDLPMCYMLFVTRYRLPQKRRCSTNDGWKKTLCLALSLQQCVGTYVIQDFSLTVQVYLPKPHLWVHRSPSKSPKQSH